MTFGRQQGFLNAHRTVRGIQSPSKPVAWNLKWLFFPNFTNMKDLKITHLMIDKSVIDYIRETVYPIGRDLHW